MARLTKIQVDALTEHIYQQVYKYYEDLIESKKKELEKKWKLEEESKLFSNAIEAVTKLDKYLNNTILSNIVQRKLDYSKANWIGIQIFPKGRLTNSKLRKKIENQIILSTIENMSVTAITEKILKELNIPIT